MQPIWKILGVIAIILLIGFWRKRNSVWGGFTAGVVVGAVIGLISLFRGSGFSWVIVSKAAIIGIMLGGAAELLGRVGDYFKKRQ